MSRAQAGLIKMQEKDLPWEMGLLEEHWINCAKRLQQVPFLLAKLESYHIDSYLPSLSQVGTAS